ncbi:MAG TPA: hypothetical protein VMS12_02870 [Thermoanaerobaculia bacterium]|nr:hypothetical protein [Thermoanaerobaculia bacterium]
MTGKNLRLTLQALFATGLLITGPAAVAQSASDSIAVTASNTGSANFQITAASYNFGVVQATGGPNSGGTQVLTGVPNGSGATYTAPAATTWTARSAPPRTIRIFNASFSSIINWGTADRLAMQIPVTNLPVTAVSCGYKTFTTVGDGLATCNNGALVRNFSAGMGINVRTGNLDFRLTVNDSDGPGTNTWAVVLTAAGF